MLALLVPGVQMGAGEEVEAPTGASYRMMRGFASFLGPLLAALEVTTYRR